MYSENWTKDAVERLMKTWRSKRKADGVEVKVTFAV
jgi:hypothetical protein